MGGRGRLRGKRFGSGGLLGRRILYPLLAIHGELNHGSINNAFSYEYYARPESWVAGREGHVYAMWTSLFETRAGVWSESDLRFWR